MWWEHTAPWFYLRHLEIGVLQIAVDTSDRELDARFHQHAGALMSAFHDKRPEDKRPEAIVQVQACESVVDIRSHAALCVPHSNWTLQMCV